MPAHKDMTTEELLELIENLSNKFETLDSQIAKVNDLEASWNEKQTQINETHNQLQNDINLTNTHKDDYTNLEKKVNVFLYGDENDSNNVGVIKKIEQIENFWEGKKQGEERKGGFREQVEKKINEIKTFWEGSKDEEGESTKGYKEEIETSWNEKQTEINETHNQLQNDINLINTHEGDYAKLEKKVNDFFQGDIKDFWEGRKNEDGEEITGMKDEINNLYNKINDNWEGEKNEDGEEILGMKDRIDNLWNRISDDWEGEKEGTERKGGLRERVEKLRNEIETFWKGAKDEEGKISKGYKDKIETWNEDMHIKIEDLLSSATNVSLGRGYQEQLDKHEENANRYGMYFKWGLIVFIIIFSSLLIYILFVANVGSDYISSLIENKLHYMILPISATLLGLVIWLGTFIKDKEKEERILHAEYSHKKRFIDFFVGYMRDIEKLDVKEVVDTQSALTKLYNEMIDSAGHNPSLRIQQKGSDHFIQAIADKVSSKTNSSKPSNENAIKE